MNQAGYASSSGLGWVPDLWATSVEIWSPGAHLVATKFGKGPMIDNKDAAREHLLAVRG